MKIIRDLNESPISSTPLSSFFFPRHSSPLRISLNSSVSTLLHLISGASYLYITQKKVVRLGSLIKFGLVGFVFSFGYFVSSEVYFGILRRRGNFDNSYLQNLMAGATAGLFTSPGFIRYCYAPHPLMVLVHVILFVNLWTLMDLGSNFQKARIFELSQTEKE